MKSDQEKENKISVLESAIKNRALSDPVVKESGVSDEELIKQAVYEEINRKAAVDKDIERRKCNIIIYRVPEKRTDDVAQRKLDDETFVKDLLDGVFNKKIEEGDIVRWAEDKNRPLLVSFKDEEFKDSIMSNLFKLKLTVARFKGISIAHDLHPSKRNEIKCMIEAAKQQHIQDGVDSAENYRFLVVGRGPRRKVLKLRKSVSSA